MAKTSLQPIFGQDLEAGDILAVWLEDGQPVHGFLFKHIAPEYVTYSKVLSVGSAPDNTGAVAVVLGVFTTSSGDQNQTSTRVIGRLDSCYVLNGVPTKLLD